ncbi:unnamed protein product [Prunus brigantina]
MVLGLLVRLKWKRKAKRRKGFGFRIYTEMGGPSVTVKSAYSFFLSQIFFFRIQRCCGLFSSPLFCSGDSIQSPIFCSVFRIPSSSSFIQSLS